MPRFSVSGNSTIVPTSARGGVSLHATAAVEAKVRQIEVYNTAATSFVVNVQRLTNATGVGAGLTEVAYDAVSTAACTATAGHTSDPGLGSELMRAYLGAAIGAGVIWTFDAEPLRIANATANGISLLCPTGTGQTFAYVITWDE